MDYPSLTPSPHNDLTCPFRESHVLIESRLATAESKIANLSERIQEYDISALKDVVAELRKDIAVLRTKLWFYQMGATAAGGLIVLLMNKLMEH